jgi:outer membrane receptor protein involved in Fe transport
VGAFYDDVYDEWEYGARIPNYTKTTAWDAINYYACYYSAFYEAAPCPIPETDIFYWNNFRRTIKQTAVFGEVSYNFTDKLKGTVGGRWFRFDKDEFQQYYSPYLAPPPGSYGSGEGRTEASGTNDDTIWKIGLQYDFDDDRMIYGLVSQGFRLGGRNNPRVVNNNPNVPETFDPDKLTNYELGVKTRWLDGRLTLNASLFKMEWDDIQINSTVGEKWWQRGTWNGETGETTGVEINGSFYITENLLLEGSVFLADAKYTADTYRPCTDPDDCDPTLWIENGQEMPGSPDTKIWAAIEYSRPGAFGLGGDMWFRYDTTYQSDTWDDLDAAAANDPVGLIPSWSSANFQVGWATQSDWTYTLFVRNIWNDKGINSLQSSTYYYDYFGQPGSAWLRTLQRPRTISLNVTKRF